MWYVAGIWQAVANSYPASAADRKAVWRGPTARFAGGRAGSVQMEGLSGSERRLGNNSPRSTANPWLGTTSWRYVKSYLAIDT